LKSCFLVNLVTIPVGIKLVGIKPVNTSENQLYLSFSEVKIEALTKHVMNFFVIYKVQSSKIISMIEPSFSINNYGFYKFSKL
jgi:hypothetical protein